MDVLSYIKLGLSTAAVVVCLWLGYHWGAGNVQSAWDKQTAAMKIAEDAQRTSEQAKADAAAKDTQARQSAYADTIKNLTQELYDANISLGACGRQPLDALRMQQYKRNAASL